jgi:hypothetical protein
MSGSRWLGWPPRQTMIRPAMVSSARNVIVASAMSAGVSTGGRAASSAGVRRARDRREAGVSTRPGQMHLTRTPTDSRSGDRQPVNRITPAFATAYSGASWLVVPSHRQKCPGKTAWGVRADSIYLPFAVSEHRKLHIYACRLAWRGPVCHCSLSPSRKSGVPVCRLRDRQTAGPKAVACVSRRTSRRGC